MPAPTTVRFDAEVVRRLASYVTRHPGSSRSSAAARFVEEGLRMEEHPGVHFRDGAMGRRATVAGGPDVWEVVRDVKSTRAAEPELTEAELLELVEDNTGVPRRMIRTALDYWGAYPDEVDALIENADRAARDQVVAALRAQSLLQR